MIRSQRSALLLALLPLPVALAACSTGSSSGNPDAFLVRNTKEAVDGTTGIVVVGPWAVFLADENFLGPAGTDLNGDGDTLDDVAVAINVAKGKEFRLGAAASSAAIVGAEIFLDVDEAQDGNDWNSDGMADDRVVLHWSQSDAALTYVDTISPQAGALAFATAGTRVYWASATAPAGTDETSLRYVEKKDPLTPVTVLDEAGAGTLSPTPLGDQEGLVFLQLDETVEGVDLNGDTDTTDAHVLALLDGTDPDARVKSVGLALRDDSAPLAALPQGSGHDWLVAFLVDEADQNANLNDQALFTQMLLPDSCAGTPDMDMNDQVLHYLSFATFLAGTSSPVDTGLAGESRVVAVPGAVATLSPEADANCDLNEDADAADVMVRWVRTQTPIQPPRDPSVLLAAETATPGGSMGLATLANRLIEVVSEAQDSRDHDGKVQDHDLVAWIDPTNLSATWEFVHQDPNTPSHGTGVFDSTGASEPYAGASWMGLEEQGRLGIAFQEEVPGTNPKVGSLNTNVACNFVAKDSDVTDSLPTWCDFESGPTLDFDGIGVAISKLNSGIVITPTHAFFRVSEADDNFDWDGDGQKTHMVLMRNPRTTCGPRAMGPVSSLSGPSIYTDGRRGAAFFTNETAVGKDLNKDGDMNDIVVRFFSF